MAPNCKLNKRFRELDCADDLLIQPFAHDGGLALGGEWLMIRLGDIEPMMQFYWGSAPDVDDVRTLLERNKLAFEERDDVER